MKDAEAEGVQMLFPGCDLEEENKALRAEIERLRKVLAANGLTSASALIKQCNCDLPVVTRRPEDRQERAKQRIALFRSLFHGREDVYARRWTNADGRAGYALPEQKDNVANKTRSLTRLSRSCNPQ